ncbi:Uncharacterised protein [Bordetella pertussis]|nr:Uncharacterised protein [Bordetella pertussis]
MVRRPSPGRLNTLSVITTPLIRKASPMPMTVTMGIAALRSTCCDRMRSGGTPLALAVRTKSSFRTSSTLARVTREISDM